MSDEKTEEPTPRKLKKARDKGEVFKSTDLTQTVVFVTLFGAGSFGFMYWLPLLQDELRAWPLRIVQLAAAPPEDSLSLVLAAAFSAAHTILLPLAVLFGASITMGLLAAGLQVRGILSADPLTPKAERLNPGANLKRLVSTRNLYDLVKILVKVLLISSVVYVLVKAALPEWLAYMLNQASATQPGVLLARTVFGIVLACLAIYVLASGVDYGHQFYEYIKQQRMSKDELRREYKEVEGDPYIKGYRNALMRAMATESPTEGIKQARVVVTNPTHYAVALAYDPLRGGLPRVVAKGADRVALAIREQARRLGVPVIENRALARKLHARVALGATVPGDTLADVARLLAQVPVLAGAVVGQGDAGVRRL